MYSNGVYILEVGKLEMRLLLINEKQKSLCLAEKQFSQNVEITSPKQVLNFF